MKFGKQMFGYKKKQVDSFIERSQSVAAAMEEQKQRIVDLVKENEELKGKLQVYDERDKSIGRTISTANETADEIISKAQSVYEMEIKRVKTFQLLWEQIAYKLLAIAGAEKVKDASRLSEKLDTLLNNFISRSGANINTVNTENLTNPINRVSNMFNSQAIAAANLQAQSTKPVIELSEVIKVTSTLEELCKELGLM